MSDDAENGKNPDAVALGAMGGRKGGLARAASLTPERRREIAQDAAHKRWKTQPQPATLDDIVRMLTERLAELEREIPLLQDEREVVQRLLNYYHNYHDRA